MILSLTHGFIFVHVPKTAGSAVTTALRPHGHRAPHTVSASIRRRLPMVEPPETAHFRIHDTAAHIRAKLSPEVYARFLSFSVVRDPFDHAVSHFEYMKQFRSRRIAARFARMSFEAYLADRMKKRRIFDRLFARLPDQTHFLLGPDGRLAVDRVLRFESIEADFRALAAELDIPAAAMTRRNPTRARRPGRPLAEWYDATTADMVRHFYRRDFALLGYSTAAPGGSDHSA